VNDDLVGSIPARTTPEQSTDQTAERRAPVISQRQSLVRLAGMNGYLVMSLMLLLLLLLLLMLLLMIIGHGVVAVISHHCAFGFFSCS
jgi:hypothetical protein